MDETSRKGLFTINAFENMEKAQAAFTSAAYKDARKIGDRYAAFRIFAVEGRRLITQDAGAAAIGGLFISEVT
jgi:uncharacterized protein (DUF1330 family)